VAVAGWTIPSGAPDSEETMKHLLLAGCCVLASLCAIAQEGAPAGTMKKAESGPAVKAEPLDPAAEAWIQMLAKRIVDAQPLVRDSAIAGLERIGKPALPTLNALASGSDKALAEAAKKLADRITRGPQPGEGRFAQGGGERNFGPDIDALAKEMKLDDQKTQKLKDLRKASQDRMRETFEAVAAGDVTREEAREEMNQYREEMKKELRKFLTEDEAKKVEESFSRGWGGRRGGGGGGGGAGGEGGGGRRRPQ
jgi:hypothetical protein